MKIIANNLPWYSGIQLLFTEEHEGIRRVATLMELKKVEKGDVVEPTISLNDHDAQELIDQLYHCGLRPTEGRGSSGQLKATQDHLNDMRAIVGKLSDVTLKES